MVANSFSVAGDSKTTDLSKLKGFTEHLIYFITFGRVDCGARRAQEVCYALRKIPTEQETKTFCQGSDEGSLIFAFAGDDNNTITATINRNSMGDLSLTTLLNGSKVDHKLPHDLNIREMTIQLVTGHLQQCHEHNASPYCSMANADLRGINLADIILYNANFASSNLTDATFTNSNLNCANFTDANLAGADMMNTTLNEASMENAYLANTIFVGASMDGVHMDSAILLNTKMPDGRVVTGSNGAPWPEWVKK